MMLSVSSPISMICTSVALAAAITLLPVAKPVTNSVEFYDNKIQLTQRVEDRSICDDLNLIHKIQESPDWSTLTARQQELRKAARFAQRRGNLKANQQHCKSRRTKEGASYSLCEYDPLLSDEER
jgi:hypothetical protein